MLLLIISLLIFSLPSLSCQSLGFVDTRESCKAVRNGTKTNDGCKCLWVRTNTIHSMECCCIGEVVKDLSDVVVNVSFLYLYKTNISDVGERYFEKYPYLKDLEIDAHAHLDHFDSSSLAVARALRKLSVTRCPKLTEVSGKIFENNSMLKVVDLSNNGLEAMPSFRMLHNDTLADKVDLSGNRIRFVREKNFRSVRSKYVDLSNNNLNLIVAYAFIESRFVKLIISDNPNLESISVDAFKNMMDLQVLDVSRTAIKSLPTAGLSNLNTLILKDVPSLKSLPSVMSFPKLQTADFTYPHHCCLFKHIKKGENQKTIKRSCKNKTKKAVVTVIKPPSLNRIVLPANNESNFFDDLIDPIDDLMAEIEDDEEREAYQNPSAETCDEVIEEIEIITTFNIKCTPQPDSLNPCDRIVGYEFLRPAIWVVCLAAIVGNIAVWVLLALAYERRMKMHYLYMINMSIADMITGVYLAVLAIADGTMSHEYYRNAVWWQTGWGCKLTGFLAIFGSELGIISLFLIAFEMSYNTRQSFRGRRLRARTGVLLMVGGWIFAFTMAILPWFGVSSYSDTSVCLPLRASSLYDKSYLIFGLSFNFLAFVAMALSYGFIVKMLKENETREEDRALITKMALLVVTDLICWFPTLFFGFTALVGLPLITLRNAKFVLVFFFPINAFANPFLYVFFTKVIHHRVKTKTMPVIRRITTSPIRGVSSLSNFYNSQPPGSHRPSREEPNKIHLAVTQTTSLNSTPRGSRASDAMLYEYTRSPRVSFEVPVSPTTTKSDRKKRISLLRRMVSTVPENSDLSEHSSESHHEHVPNQDNRIRTSINRIFNLSRRNNGSDSGRGSLASSSTDPRDERVSLTSNLLLDVNPPTTNNKLILPGFSTTSRRKSTPAIPFLVVSDCS